MKYIKCRWLLAMIMSCSLFSCTNLDEEVFDRVDAGIYYQDETSVQGAVAAIYSKAAYSYLEYFWYLQEFSADQVAWRSWNGGLWGWDEALKFCFVFTYLDVRINHYSPNLGECVDHYWALQYAYYRFAGNQPRIYTHD